MKNYLTGIWKARYFWIHLSLSDLRSRWRNSFFGASWSILQPLGMTLLLACVLSRLFKADILSYIPYILSGIILWEFISTTITGGSLSFVQADAYIKQCRQPLAIYTLRTVLTAMLIFMISSLSLFGWVLLAMPQNFGMSWFAALTIYPIVVLMAWPAITFLAYIGARFRDIAPALSLVLQAVWFISPVYLQEKLFRDSGLGWLVDNNPVYHLLQIMRAPLLNGEYPTIENYLFCFATALFFLLLALITGRSAERKVIFYL